MKKTEPHKYATVLLLVSVLLFSLLQFPTQEKKSLEKSDRCQFSQNIDIEDGLPLRSIAEEIPEIEQTSVSLDYVSVELFYSSIIKVQFIQKRFESIYLGSSDKRYLVLLRLLI